MRQNTTFRSYGTVGISQPQGTLVTSLSLLPPARYRVWGSARHTLVDGIRLIATGQSTLILSNTPNVYNDFGPIVMDLTGALNTILLELQTATGGADTASASLYAEALNQ